MLNQGSFKEGCKRKLLNSLGLVYLVPCWELAGGTELWKLLCQVKPGALGVGSMKAFQVGLVVPNYQAAGVPCTTCAGAVCWAVGSQYLQMTHEHL